MSPGSRRSGRGWETVGFHIVRQPEKAASPVVDARSAVQPEDDRATSTAAIWAHSRYRAHIPWNQTLCFPRSQLLEGLTLRCTEGGGPVDQVCHSIFFVPCFTTHAEAA